MDSYQMRRVQQPSAFKPAQGSEVPVPTQTAQLRVAPAVKVGSEAQNRNTSASRAVVVNKNTPPSTVPGESGASKNPDPRILQKIFRHNRDANDSRNLLPLRPVAPPSPRRPSGRSRSRSLEPSLPTGPVSLYKQFQKSSFPAKVGLHDDSQKQRTPSRAPLNKTPGKPPRSGLDGSKPGLYLSTFYKGPRLVKASESKHPSRHSKGHPLPASLLKDGRLMLRGTPGVLTRSFKTGKETAVRRRSSANKSAECYQDRELSKSGGSFEVNPFSVSYRLLRKGQSKGGPEAAGQSQLPEIPPVPDAFRRNHPHFQAHEVQGRPQPSEPSYEERPTAKNSFLRRGSTEDTPTLPSSHKSPDFPVVSNTKNVAIPFVDEEEPVANEAEELLSKKGEEDNPKEPPNGQEGNPESEKRVVPPFQIWNQLVFARGGVRRESGGDDGKESLVTSPDLRSHRQSMALTDVEISGKIWFKNTIFELSGNQEEAVRLDCCAGGLGTPAPLSPHSLELALERLNECKGKLLGKNQILSPIVASEKFLPKFPTPKVVRMIEGPLRGCAANSHCGIKRVGNEDRVAVSVSQASLRSMTNCSDLKNRSSTYALCSVFDGHGGVSVADFLKDRFHQAMAAQIETGGLSAKDIRAVFQRMDEEAIELSTLEKNFQSGSCALSLLVMEEGLILMNVGDSRCVASQSHGSILRALSTDHKPELISEFSRIVEAGGRVERESVSLATKVSEFHFASKLSHVRAINKLKKASPERVFSPWRIFPGGLTVSRSLGDASSKRTEFGGRPGTVAADPDIQDFETDDFDFIVLACGLKSGRRLRGAKYGGRVADRLGNHPTDASGVGGHPPRRGNSPGRVRQQRPEAGAGGGFRRQRVGGPGQFYASPLINFPSRAFKLAIPNGPRTQPI